MADTLNIEIHGLSDLRKKLERLPDRIEKKVIRQSLREGAKIVRKAVRDAAPVGNSKYDRFKGRLRRGIVYRNSKIHNKRPEIGLFLTIRKVNGGGRNHPQDAFYGRFVNDGYYRGKKTERVTTVRRGAYRQGALISRLRGTKFISGKDFVGRGFRAAQNQALTAIISAAERNIENEIRAIGG